jgi:hypothetical protein
MVEKATYGITALRYAGTHIVEAMMGLIDARSARWDMRPVADARDRSGRPPGGGRHRHQHVPRRRRRPAARPRGQGRRAAGRHETLALDEDRPGPSLDDLPRF